MSTAVNNDKGPQVIYKVSVLNRRDDWAHDYTTVQVSIQSTSGSEDRYLESDKAYSFHSWPKKSCMLAILPWLITKYPSKKRWIDPAIRSKMGAFNMLNQLHQHLLRTNHRTKAWSQPFKPGLALFTITKVTANMIVQPAANVRMRLTTSQSLAVNMAPDNVMPTG